MRGTIIIIVAFLVIVLALSRTRQIVIPPAKPLEPARQLTSIRYPSAV